jgi:hypothetical protein
MDQHTITALQTSYKCATTIHLAGELPESRTVLVHNRHHFSRSQRLSRSQCQGLYHFPLIRLGLVAKTAASAVQP